MPSQPFHFVNHGVLPMRLHRMLTALDRFEDSPAGQALGLITLALMLWLPLAIGARVEGL